VATLASDTEYGSQRTIDQWGIGTYYSYAQKIVFSSSVLVENLYVYVYSSSSFATLTLMEDDGGSPGSGGVCYCVSLLSGTGWQGGAVSGSPVSVSAGTYWLVIQNLDFLSDVTVGRDLGNGYGQDTKIAQNGVVWSTVDEDMSFKIEGSLDVFDPPVPSPLNFMSTKRRLVAFSENAAYYEE
jgi:hypothetical protein